MQTSIIKIQYNFVVKIHSYNGNVVSVEQTKKLLSNPKLSDEEAEEIRDGFRFLAEVVFDKWSEERKQTSKEIIN